MKKNIAGRRKGALTRLQAQLERGTKTELGTVDKQIPLTDKDTKRIEKEINILTKKMRGVENV